MQIRSGTKGRERREGIYISLQALVQLLVIGVAFPKEFAK